MLNKMFAPVFKILFFPLGIFNIVIARLGEAAGIVVVCLVIIAIIVMLQIIAFVYLHFTNSILLFNIIDKVSSLFMHWVALAVILPYIYSWFWHKTHTGFKKALVLHSSVLDAIIEARLAGVKIIFRDLGFTYLIAALFTPVYEIHIKPKIMHRIDITLEDLHIMLAEFEPNFKGSIVYAITPMNLEKLVTEQGIPYSLLIAKKTTIDPKRALVFRDEPSHFWFYFIDLR